MKKVTKEEFLNRVKNRFPEEFFEIIEYSGVLKPLAIKCLNCGEIIQVSQANNFMAPNKRYGCKNCYGLWKEREQLWNLIDKYYTYQFYKVKDTHKFYIFTCKKCGYKRIQSLSNMRRHLRCGCYTNNIHRTKEEFLEQVPEKYEVISSFEGMLKKVKLRCLDCGFIWEVRPADLMYRGSSCPHCNDISTISKGERLVQQYLDTHNIKYIREQRLKNKKLRFDFWLPENDIAIEYNGRQHYKYIKFFHQNNQGFKKMKERDEEKRRYCRDNNITLLEIPYTWKQVTVIKYLSEYLGSTTIA